MYAMVFGEAGSSDSASIAAKTPSNSSFELLLNSSNEAPPGESSGSEECSDVGGVPSNAREDTLLTHFAAFEPQKVSLAAGKSFAFITFATPELAKRAIHAAPTMPFHGHTLALELSKAR